MMVNITAKIARRKKRRDRRYLRKHSNLPSSLIRVLPYRKLRKIAKDIYSTICIRASYDYYDNAPTIPNDYIVNELDYKVKYYIKKYLHKTFVSYKELYKYCNWEWVEFY